MVYMTNSELLIMKCVWDYGGEIPMSQLIKDLAEKYNKSWKRTTVRTFITRLENKECLYTYRTGRNAFVQALLRKEDFRTQRAKQIVEFWYEGSALELVSYVFKNKEITDEEKGKVKRYLNEL
ncbi:copper transport repressor%2C CopY/TcrY family [uncultured Roseburia sp.]|uniref:BlaI/MecI/CopY family transcriptional regulator n=1 Tax=Brotonthovivens ammoniilytica TaxID=2981725 RepID=A0ABT2TMX5_9FIRM|nr:BlaI/MecI/CopY family transcriptional regulator [Brotonthovivens ammoniilytica]MCU6763536.1 BlaI/MecI/CopY family transcriptional regulator [Brotonthovivens ammoniilytica]SCJ24308.1 copper transport repressor%2C CopY/TcrY family [uncultured Roseburia sp.]